MSSNPYQNYGPATNYNPEDEEEDDPYGGYRAYPPQYYQPSYPDPRGARPGPVHPGDTAGMRAPGARRFTRSTAEEGIVHQPQEHVKEEELW